MHSRITPVKYVVYCMIISLLAYIIVWSFTGYLNFSVRPEIILGTAVTSNIVFYLAFMYTTFLMVAGIPVLLYGIIYYIARKDDFILKLKLIVNTIYNCMLWFNDYLYKPIDVIPYYAVIISILFTILISLGIFMLVVRRRLCLLSMGAGVVVLSVMWFTGYNEAFAAVKQYIFLSFVLYGYINYSERENGWKLRRNTYSKETPFMWAACTLSLITAVFLAAGMLPAAKKPLGKLNDGSLMSSIENIWNNYQSGSVIIKDIAGRKFDMSSIGYQEGDSKLGGAVRMTNMLLLRAKIDGDIKGPVYLRGNIKDTYTGDKWTKSVTSPRRIKDSEEIVELFGDMKSVGQYKTINVTVYPRLISTTSIFNVWMPQKVDVADNNYLYDMDGEVYLLQESSNLKNEYNVISSVPVVYSDDLRKSQSTKNTYDMSRYLTLPEDLPERVKKLASDITLKYENDYDRAVAIQNYLRNTYPYTLNTKSLPEGRDFVDYFLFEEKKGYCTYFASAMAVMSRAVSIPSRYVEGLVLDEKDKDEDGIYTVMSNRAHAWVELYFDGFGWVRFEPTSSYQIANYERPGQNQEIAYANAEGSDKPHIPQIDSRDIKETDGRENGKSSMGKLPWGVMAGALILSAIGIRILVKIYKIRRSIQKAERLDGKESAMQYFSILEEKLALAGIQRNTGETPGEFGERIKPMLTPYGIDGASIVKSFERVRFGNAIMDEGTRELFRQAIHKADLIVKDKLGNSKFLAHKYIL